MSEPTKFEYEVQREALADILRGYEVNYWEASHIAAEILEAGYRKVEGGADE